MTRRKGQHQRVMARLAEMPPGGRAEVVPGVWVWKSVQEETFRLWIDVGGGRKLSTRAFDGNRWLEVYDVLQRASGAKLYDAIQKILGDRWYSSGAR